mgnify:CR=1 FL=1
MESDFLDLFKIVYFAKSACELVFAGVLLVGRCVGKFSSSSSDGFGVIFDFFVLFFELDLLRI